MITKIEITQAIIEEMGNQAALDLLTAEGYLRWLSGQPIREENLQFQKGRRNYG